MANRNSPPHGAHGDSRNTRREARELALRMLFQLDLGKQPVTDEVDRCRPRASPSSKAGTGNTPKNWCAALWTHLAEIDRRITELTPEWTPDRQAAVDRNLLRLAAYELLYRPDAPVAAVVNEAVELAKKVQHRRIGPLCQRRPRRTRPSPARG